MSQHQEDVKGEDAHPNFIHAFNAYAPAGIYREKERYKRFRNDIFSSNNPSIELGAPPIHILSRTLTAIAIYAIVKRL